MATSRIERLMAKRTAERRVRALRCALAAIPALNEQGVEAYVIGSLATGRFMSHSDVDYLVIGHNVPMQRRLVEATIARTMAGSNVGYDVVYEEDINEDLLKEFLRARADAPRLLELAHEAVAAGAGNDQSA
jgi:predicted nucleotidyltransferase